MIKLLNTVILIAAFTGVIAQSNQRLSNDVAWLDAANVRAAFEDMRKIKDYNAAGMEQQVKELEDLCKVGFAGFESGNAEAKLRAERAVALKRTILMSNPLLDGDKIILGRYKIKGNARGVGTGSMGTH